MRKPNKAEASSQLVYDGRTFLGAISRKGDRYLALDPDGRRIGSFRKSREAFLAILARRELDAIAPDVLRGMVKDVIERHLPPHQFRVLKVAEASERQLIGGLVAVAKRALQDKGTQQ